VRSENFGQEHRTLVVRTLATSKDEEVPARMSNGERVSWSPDGTRLLIEGSDHRGRGGVFVFDLESKRVSLVALDPKPGPHGLQASFSGDGKAVLFARGADLVEKTLESGEERTLFSADEARQTLLPAVALGGQGRAFVVARQNGLGGVLYAERAGDVGRTEVLDLPSGRFTDLLWTPKGDALIVGTEGKEGLQLWRVSPAGDAMQPIATAADRVPGVTVDPNSGAILYAAGAPREEVWVLDHATEAKLGVER
jgi:Tol biopolymer transport system component